MAKRAGMYSSNKRKKELKRQKKQEEKRQKRQNSLKNPSLASDLSKGSDETEPINSVPEPSESTTPETDS
jgi:hypothetical protein